MPIYDLEAGDCFSDYQDPLASSADVSAVRALPCEEEHSYELFHIFTIGQDEDAWPGDDAVIEAAVAGCFPAFEEYVGEAYGASGLDFSFLYPNAEGWRGFDRDVLCYLYDRRERPLSGSMRASSP
jgi:hypothetical protein